VQSIAIEEPEEVKSEEKAEVTEVGNEVAVTVSQSALVLDFQPKASRLNDEAIERVTAFSQTSELAQGNRVIEVVGFAGVGAGNVSDARRTAYYRAMVVRSEMVKAGIDPARINIAVRDTTEESEGSKVRVFGR
jgi:type IV pilus biogenesis protein CpaD/CtpE